VPGKSEFFPCPLIMEHYFNATLQSVFFLSCSRSLALSIFLSIFFSLCVSLRYNEEYE